jgi:hypothetical protein
MKQGETQFARKRRRNRMRKVLVGMLLALVHVLGAVSLLAEVSVRECITSSPPSGQAYSLPADGQWYDMASLVFNHNSASDYIITTVAEFTPGDPVNALEEYQITVDGIQYGWFTHRSPEVYPTTQTMRAVAPDLPAGIHTIALRAHNLSPAAVLYSRVWISPLLVDSSETTLKNYGTGGSVTVGSAWTNLAQANISVPAGKMLYLAGFATVTGGPALTGVQYRLTSASVIDTYNDSVPDVVSDGVHVASVYRPGGTSSATYWFQAKSLGGSFTVGARELVLQTIPAFTTLEATGGAISFPNDDLWHTIAQSPWISLPASAVGPYGTDGSGYAYYTYTGSLAAEASIKFDLQVNYAPPFDHWEVGWLGVNPSGYTKLEASNSDWELLGFRPADMLRMNFQAQGLCNSDPRPMSFSKSRFQVMIVPNSLPYTNASCATNSSVCCANNSPTCLRYDCQMLLGLQSGVPNRNCS